MSSLGKVIIISGPSGAGKTTLVRQVFQRLPQLVHSISATTRPARPGEFEGADYHFLSSDEFHRRREQGDFLECCQVFGRGYWYGTLTSEVTPSLAEGKSVVLEVDVQGAKSVFAKYPEAITIFVRPKSIEELERRLVARGTESLAAIECRLDVARRELAEADWYQFQVVNDDVDEAVDALANILIAHGV
jgi:guanylate kinase